MTLVGHVHVECSSISDLRNYIWQFYSAAYSVMKDELCYFRRRCPCRVYIRRILLQCVVITSVQEDARQSNHVTSRPADDSGWTYDPFVGVALQYLIWHFYRRRGSGILSAPVEPVQWWADLQGGDEGVQAPTVTTVTLRGKRRSVAKRCQESYDRLPCRQPRRHHSPLTMAHPTIQPNMRVDLSPRLGGDTVANQPPPNYCPPLIHLQSSPHLLPWTV